MPGTPENNVIAAILRRLDANERNASDLAASHTRQIAQSVEMMERVFELEKHTSDNRVDNARREEREKAVQKDIADLKHDLGEIKSDLKGGFNKLLVIVATPIVAAIILFIVRGGLKIA